VAAPIGRFIVRCRFDGAIWLCHMTLLSVVRCRLAVSFGSAFWLCHWVVSFGFAVCWTVALCHVIWQCFLAVQFGSVVGGAAQVGGIMGSAAWTVHWVVLIGAAIGRWTVLWPCHLAVFFAFRLAVCWHQRRRISGWHGF